MTIALGYVEWMCENIFTYGFTIYNLSLYIFIFIAVFLKKKGKTPNKI